MIRSAVFALTAFFCFVSQSLAAEDAASVKSSIGRTIADFTAQDFLGAKVSLADWADKKAVVVVFLGAECPLSKMYAKRIGELSAKYAGDGVQFVGINANRQDSLEDIAHFAKELKVEFPLVKDTGNKVADQFGATRTPEVFLLNRDRSIVYSGRIDDQYGVGYVRGKTTATDLTLAIDELLAGKPISTPVTAAVGCIIGRVRSGAPTGDITYTKQIAPILNAHCVRCHREGEVAPFAMSSYLEIVGWSDTIAEVVRNERMPPWHANPAHGSFANDSRLSDADKQLILDWVKNGSPEGNASDLPKAPQFVDGWQIPKPDMLIEMPSAYNVPARGVVPYQHFTVEKTFDKDVWIRAAEIRPGAREVVHHLILFYIPPGQGRMRPEDTLANSIATYVPGLPAMNLPDGYAHKIPAGAKLVFQAHYTPNGTAMSDRSVAGLVFVDPKDVKHELSIAASMNFRFRIPPGAKDYRITTTYRVGQDSMLFALTPHMHYRGKSFRFTARYPDGHEEILLDVPKYDFNWQNVYQLAEPKRLPETTQVEMVAYYDNSAENMLNPDPTKAVMWGDQTWEEMMIGTLTMCPAEQDLSAGGPSIEAIEGNAGKKRITFRYKPTQPTKKVYLAGSFNEWKPTGHAMEGPDKDGWFATSVELVPGDYEYKFALDGTTWRPDPGNREQNGYFLNSVLHVK